MSTAPLLPFRSAAEELPRKRFTRQEVERLQEAGAFDGQRYELIDGDLFDKMGQNPPHASAIRRIHGWLTRILGGDRVQEQLPIEAAGGDLERSLPEPDVAVLADNKPEYEKRHPRGDELLLAVEVSDSTAAFDLGRKAAIYANARVPEYWVVDLPRRMLVVHRNPDGPTYRLVQLFSAADTVTMADRTEVLNVSEILPEK